MNTVTVDISQVDLTNFVYVTNKNLENMNESQHEDLFNLHPFTLYQNRMHGNHMVTMQIPLMDFILFLGHGLVK